MDGTVLHTREKKAGVTVTVGGFSYRTPCIHIMNTVSNKIYSHQWHNEVMRDEHESRQPGSPDKHETKSCDPEHESRQPGAFSRQLSWNQVREYIILCTSNVKFQFLLCSKLLNNTSVSGNFILIYLKYLHVIVEI